MVSCHKRGDGRMDSFYSDCIDYIECSIGDKVLIYPDHMIGKNGEIDTDMIGIVESIEQYKLED